MIRVTIRFGEPLRKAVGQRRVTLELPDQTTVAQLLEELAAHYPGFEGAWRGKDLGREAPYILFLRGRPVTARNYAQTLLQDGDLVQIVLPVVGGEPYE